MLAASVITPAPSAPAKASLMVTAVAVTPLSVTLPLVAPLASFTVRLAVAVAVELGAGEICADVIVTLKTGLFFTATVRAAEVAV